MENTDDFLVNDAYRKVWCSPTQDRQHRIGPKRMSKKGGALGDILIGMRKWNLPTQSDRYHVFNIGDLPPELVGMDTIKDRWVSARAHAVATSLLINIYTDSGLNFPLFQSYFLYTRNGALIVAIKRNDAIADLSVVQPYVRWRSNAYFDGDGAVPINAGIEVEGIVPTSEAAFYRFQVKWRAAKLKPGYAIAYVNGRRVKDLNLTTLNVGDTIEYVRDASIKEVLEIPVKSLKAFDSILDHQAKYLLPRPGLGATIDYWDDIDVFLLNYQLAMRYSGYYYHFNREDSIRMVTHRDYSIPVAYLTGYVQNSPDGWFWNQDLRIELVIRHGGWNDRALTDEHHRIKELFKLPEEKRLKAMMGETSADIWRATVLENSAYTQLMRSEFGQIDRQMVEDAYGYNAISRLVGDTPQTVEPGQKWVKLPYSLAARSTVYEYDAGGLLIGWYQHDCSIEYPLRNTTTRYIEAFTGIGGVGLSTEYDKPSTELKPGIDYRFYLSDIANGVAKNNWRDVTGDSRYYSIMDGKAVWNVDFKKKHTAVKSTEDFLASTVELNYYDDLLTLTVNVDEVRTGNILSTDIMAIPPGQVDVWLNKYSLVLGVDYYIAWPQICIVNKAFLNDGMLQEVTLRARGFCNSDMTLEVGADIGFVKYGALSRNSRFNVRDDKVVRICVAGQLFTRDELGFTEDGTSITVPGVANGSPYAITYPVVPVSRVTNTDTYTLRARSEAVDKQVEDYLTQGLPEPVEPLPDAIPTLYKVFSPFTTKLIYDMLGGYLSMDEFMGEYSIDDVKKKLVGYEWILPFDPIIRGYDKEYVIVHPHPEAGTVTLNVYQFRFLNRAIAAFLKGEVNLTRHAVLVEEGFEHYTVDHPHPHRTWAEVGQ